MSALIRAVATSAAANSTTQVFTKPTGTVSGDFMVIHLIINGTTQPDTPPSGWIKGDEITGGGILVQFWYKQAGGSEPADYTFTWISTISKGGGIVTVRSDISAPLGVNTFAQQTNTSSTNRQCPSVTPTQAAQLIMFIQASIAQAMTPDALSTEQYDTGAATRLYCMTEAVAAGATGTRTATGLSAATSKTFTIAVSEAVTNGAADLTLDAITLSAAGTVAIKGAASLTLDALTLTATGTVPAQAGADLILDPITLTATGTVAIKGAASLTLGALTLNATGLLPPPAPTGFTATPVTASRVDLAWSYSGQTINGFSIERSLTGVGAWSEIATPAAGDRTYSDTGLAGNTTYYYRIRGYRS